MSTGAAWRISRLKARVGEYLERGWETGKNTENSKAHVPHGTELET